jgi:hypothetical protein
MVAALDELRSVLPALFESEDYQVRRRAIDEQFRSGQEEALEALNTKAQAQNIAILRTPTGFTMAPMHEGKVVKPEVFNALPEAMRKEVEHKIEALQKDLEAILERMPKADKKRRAELSVLNEMCPRCATTCVRPARISRATSPSSSRPARRRAPSSGSRWTRRGMSASAATWSM